MLLSCVGLIWFEIKFFYSLKRKHVSATPLSLSDLFYYYLFLSAINFVIHFCIVVLPHYKYKF